MVDALSAHRSDQSFDIRVLPRTLGSRQDLVDLHRLETGPKIVAVGPVAIPQQKPWRRVPRERVADLLGRPRGRGMSLATVETERRLGSRLRNHFRRLAEPELRVARSERRHQLRHVRCFGHQLLLPRPYLVLTKTLRLDVQCQRAASVKIGWKYLDD